jgi:hypothetical protein
LLSNAKEERVLCFKNKETGRCLEKQQKQAIQRLSKKF